MLEHCLYAGGSATDTGCQGVLRLHTQAQAQVAAVSAAGRPEPQHLRGARLQHEGQVLAGRLCGQWLEGRGAQLHPNRLGATVRTASSQMQGLLHKQLHQLLRWHLHHSQPQQLAQLKPRGA